MNLISLKKLTLKSKLSNYLSIKRYYLINKIFQPLLENKKNGNFIILDVGCVQGRNFLRHSSNDNYVLISVDLETYTGFKDSRTQRYKFIPVFINN